MKFCVKKYFGLCLALGVFSLGMTGCGVMITKMVSAPGLNSKYNPMLATEFEVNSYYNMLKTVENTIVEDEQGKYFFKKEKDDVYSKFSLLNQDSILKTALSGSIGLMEPVYSLQMDLRYELDWQETKRRYSFFVDTLGIKLLPLESTRLYHELLNKVKHQSVKSVDFSNVVEFTAAAFAGEYGLYNPKYYENILSQIPGGATFLVSFTGAKSYFAQSDSSSSSGTIAYESATVTLSRLKFYTINFIPFEFFKSLKQGGAWRLFSGCSTLSKEGDLSLVRYSRAASDIPYVSGIVMAIKDRDKEKRKVAKRKYYEILKNVQNNRIRAEQACLEGFSAMNLSGSIESRRLE